MRFGGRPLALWLSAATATTTTLWLPSTAAFGVVGLSSSTTTRRTAFFFRNKKAAPATATTKRFMMTMSSSSNNNAAASPSNAATRVALCQFKISENKEINHQTASTYITRAAEAGAKLVVLPEIWNSPYATLAFEEYAEILPNVGDTTPTAKSSSSPSAQLLLDLAQQHQIYIVGGSIPEIDQGKIYNTCLVCSPSGQIVAKHRKVHLFDIDVPGGITFRESDTLSPGQSLTCFDGGDAFGMIGVGICYDIRFPEYALLLGQRYQCNLLIYPGAFNMTTGPAHWELLQRARAVDNQCFVLTASPARTSLEEDDDHDSEGNTTKKKKKYPHYTAWGHSTIISPWGDVVATTDEKETLVVADLDMSKVSEMRSSIPTMAQKRSDLYSLQDPTDGDDNGSK